VEFPGIGLKKKKLFQRSIIVDKNMAEYIKTG